MFLWSEWFRCVRELRGACSRRRTFLLMLLILAGLSLRTDLAGVTSIVRAIGLNPLIYNRLLRLFHSHALKLDRLTELWTRLVHKIFSPLKADGRLVCVVDGLKTPKEGRKMPAVKKLHQSSQNNSKPAYIMGHSLQAISILVKNASGAVVAVPLAARIHEGLIFFKSTKATLPQKMASLGLDIVKYLEGPVIFVADAFYACQEMILPLLAQGHDLVTRVRRNTVAYCPAEKPKAPRRGRPKLYGKKVKLKEMMDDPTGFNTAPSPVYGEGNIEIAYKSLQLLWRPLGRLVSFVMVIHPARGRIILMTTDLMMDPLLVIVLYGYRFKIELSFKQAIHLLGAYAYHFWMKNMKPIGRKTGDQNLEHETIHYWSQVIRKLTAYHRHIQLGCIAQGLLQYLSLTFGNQVWGNFNTWLRTMNPHQPPSELVVAYALRSSLNEFLDNPPQNQELRKIILENLAPQQEPRVLKAA